VKTLVYDGANVAQEQAGGLATANLLNGGLDEVFARSDSFGARGLLRGGAGSTVALTDAAGAVSTEYTYDPFGETARSGAASAHAGQYTGRENDRTGLYYYRARYYSPKLQRFISEDPLGFGGGDVNLYAYVGNDPVRFSDPLGLRPLEDDSSSIPYPQTIAGRKPKMGWWELFLTDLLVEPIAPRPQKPWGQRWLDAFVETNQVIPGLAAPPFAPAYLPFPGASVGQKVADMTVTPTFWEWAATGFKGAQMGAANATRLETALSVIGTGLVSNLYVGIAFEGGIAVGAAIYASFPP
jgi:RHS repeat-associated protein